MYTIIEKEMYVYHHHSICKERELLVENLLNLLFKNYLIFYKY